MKIKKWYESDNTVVNQIVVKGQNCKISYKDYLLGRGPDEISEIDNTFQSLAFLKINELYYHLFLNGDRSSDKYWFEVVVSDDEDREECFSECIYDTVSTEDDLLTILLNYGQDD